MVGYVGLYYDMLEHIGTSYKTFTAVIFHV
jgi:hypothetical protein